MDKQNHMPESAHSEDWLDEILGASNVPKELGADEMAVAAAGLTHPDDAELERIVQETMAENWGEEEPVQPAPANKAKPTVQGRKPAVPERKPSATSEKRTVSNEQGGLGKLMERLRGPGKKPYGLFGIPHIISTGIWLAIIVVIGLSLGRLGWLCAADLLALGKTPQEITITVEQGDSISDIAQKLAKAGMIEYPQLFEMFADLTGKGDHILVGSITFSDEMVYDYNALVNAMSYRGGSVITVEVVIPEGYSCAQIFALLEEKGVCSVSELEAYAASGELDSYWFLDGIERNHKYCLEGFLFPDTYEFYMDDEPKRVIEKFLDDFDYRFTDRMVAKYMELNQNLGLKLSIREVVTMASIVEKEKANNLEGYSIASVFYNRLTHASSYPYLNSDATLLYDEEYYSGRTMTDEEKSSSPFNTYTRVGLPIGPIANPGLSSLDAALSPESTDYYYFIFDKNANQHLFSRTLAEHEQKARELGY